MNVYYLTELIQFINAKARVGKTYQSITGPTQAYNKTEKRKYQSSEYFSKNLFQQGQNRYRDVS